MTVPKSDYFHIPVLEVFKDYKQHNIEEIEKYTIHYFNLSNNDLKEKTKGGKYTKFYSRVTSAIRHYKESGYFERVERGIYELTPLGKKLLKKDLNKINQNILKKFASENKDVIDVNNNVNTVENIDTYTPKSKFSYNRIFFGAPGTGKSFTLNQEKDDLLGEFSNNYERVTFHPNYSYFNFVGGYKPVPIKNNGNNETISYRYVPGPFMRILTKSLKNKSEPYLLIIEEVNRADVSSVFGDIFQLLDRDDDGFSEYPIQAPEDMRKYLKEIDIKSTSIQIPNNLYIWATMNSADQGVFVLDSAFKRRWDFTYIGVNTFDNVIKDIEVCLGKNNEKINWNSLRKSINNELLKYRINEDKLLGPFFINPRDLPDTDNKEKYKEMNAKFIDIFKNKVIMYLFEDVARGRRNSLFKTKDQSNLLFSEICEKFEEYGIEIFCEDIVNELRS